MIGRAWRCQTRAETKIPVRKCLQRQVRDGLVSHRQFLFGIHSGGSFKSLSDRTDMALGKGSMMPVFLVCTTGQTLGLLRRDHC